MVEDDLKEKYQLGLIYIFAPLTALVLTPFAIARFAGGEWIKGSINVAVVTVALLAMFFAWRQRSVVVPAIVASIFYTSGALAAIYINGPLHVVWIYSSLFANFFLLPARVALAINAVAIFAMLPMIWQIPDNLVAMGTIATLILSSGMALAFAILTERQRVALRAAATRDSLTGLGNRRLMDAELERCIETVQRHPAPASLIVLDVDRFKSVNDSFGHHLGDRLLADLAQLLARHSRSSDRVFRFGGEEFVILAQQTPLDAAAAMAENLRQQISARIQAPDGQPITVSFGCAELDAGESPSHWFTRADNALYRAKENGRNCVELAPASEVASDQPPNR